MKRLFILVFFLAGYSSQAADLRVGVARKPITPDLPFWLSGYASRDKPSTGALHDLWAKAMVIEENSKSRIIIVTTDILGLSREVSEDVAARAISRYGIDRSQLLLNSSHTHSGPVIWPALSIIFDLSPADQEAATLYTRRLADNIVEVIDMAMANLAPMQLSCGHGSAGFAVNRRQPTDKGMVIGVNPGGPVDHDVPVLKVAEPGGKLIAVLFGYTCHNTTSRSYQVNGDYAGFAQIELEKLNPGIIAMYMSGCGADQNPNPRGTVELAAEHGKSLADAVQNTLAGKLKPVRPPIRTSFTTAELEFAPFNLEKFRDEIVGTDIYKQRRAMLMLEAYNKGWDTRDFKYPVQAVRFNNDFSILAMSGEVVIDYAIAAKKRYPGENLFVAGYCTEVQCYIPSTRVLREGGYEPEESMIYYGLPGPFADNTEERITVVVSFVMKKTGARRSGK
ncbi:MAG: neutral/alkaline non-lysosomal ceramidase N-terminal domain-containing protein [Bacteroidales bacterium]|nr:neutral/alkaline non-lysosomal ceramidase N-terminal domain-containing protein [Bacteroidales bacterium]